MLVMRAVTKPENAVDARPKNFLTEAEIAGFLRAARKGRLGEGRRTVGTWHSAFV
jgi:hypothetical protein